MLLCQQKGGTAMDQQKIGAFIRALRQEKALTQEQLAERLNVSNRTVSRWETGSNMPDISTLLELCAVLDVSIQELLQGSRIAQEAQTPQDSLQEIAQYARHREERSLRHVIFASMGFLGAWLSSLALAFAAAFSTSAVGLWSVLIMETATVLVYALLMLLRKQNRTESGYVITLIGMTVALTASNIALLVLFFNTGSYVNYGIAGMYYALAIMLVCFTLAGLITSYFNKR